MSEEECDCCGFSETDMRRWKWRAEEQRDIANAFEIEIKRLREAINEFLVAEGANYHDCTPAMDDAIDNLQEVVDWHRKRLEADDE